MAGEEIKEFLVFDTTVHCRNPWVSALFSTLTVGISGAVAHSRVNRELAAIGRIRGAMPFPFIKCSPGSATAIWVIGLVCWFGAAFGVVGLIVEIHNHQWHMPSSDISLAASFSLLLIPLWMTQLHTARRIRTAQHLVGLDRKLTTPIHAAIVGVIFPPAFNFLSYKALNRAWSLWRGAQVVGSGH